MNLKSEDVLRVPRNKQHALLLSGHLRRLLSLQDSIASDSGDVEGLVITGLPEEVQRCLKYLLEPSSYPVCPPSTFEGWLQLQVQWERARRYVSMCD